jgi:hypothetical protein
MSVAVGPKLRCLIKRDGPDPNGQKPDRLEIKGGVT